MSLITAPGRIALVRRIKPFFPLLVYAAVAIFLVLLFLSSFRQIEALILQEKFNYLGTVAEEKVGEIASWRAMQKRVGEAVSRNSLLAAEFEQWLAEGALPDGRKQRLMQRLDELRSVNGYQAMVLLDRSGKARLSLPGKFDWGDEDVQRAGEAMRSGEAQFSELHRNSENDKNISIDLVAPLLVGGRIAGALVLQIDPAQSLYPLIQERQFPSESGETLLVRQDGNDVLFLNELRHVKGTALALRVPLSNQKLPAALALRGELRTADGLDYRGVPVVAEMRRIPDSPWFVISKVDRKELFGPINQLRNWSTGIALLFAAIGGMLVLVWLRGQKAQQRVRQAQLDAAEERALLVKHFEYLTKYANDIIMIADEEGAIVEANERAETAFGFTREELLCMRGADLRDPDEDPAVLAGQLKQIREAGELRYETCNCRKDGTIFPVEVSTRLITLDGVVYMQDISRDISERKRAEEALRKSETLLKESQQLAHIGSWELDLVNNILYWSDENYRIFGVDPALGDSTYEDFLNAVHPDDRAMVNEAYTSSVQNRTPYSIVHRLQFSDRPLKYVREWCESYYDAAGRPLRSVGTTQDITEQQLAQDAVRESARLIEDLYNHAPCGYHSLDKDGVIMQINDTELLWLGYAREEVIGKKNFVDMLSPASQRFFRGNFPEFKARGFVHDLEYELTRKDGSTFFVSLSATAINDAAGEYLMSRSTLFDISERKQAEKRLQESEARFRTMVNRAPIHIWMADVHDAQGYRGCNFFNQQWHDFTGMPLEKALCNGWLESVHPDDRLQCLEAYQTAFGRMLPFKHEYRLCRRDGEYRWMLDSGVPRFTEDGTFVGFIGTCIDITEKKLFEDMREEMEHIGRLNIAGEMASGLAHELSQPLSAASNYLEACLRRMEDSNWDRDVLQKAVRQAHVQAERAGAIINHLKSMVRKQKQERSMLEINALINDTVSFMDHELNHHFIKLSLDLSPAPPVLGNKIELEQVLINLIKNAIDSMTSSPQHDLSITTRVIESGTVMVSVRDTGKGIATDELDKVFNPFQTSKKEGLGLGLAICRSLIENYGGKIWAAQKEDGGAEFNFTLPAWGGL